MLGRQGFVVDKAQLTDKEVARIRAELRVRADWNPETSYGPPPPAFKIYLEDDLRFCLPRHWATAVLEPRETKDGFQVEKRESMSFVGVLNEELRQPEAAEATLAAFRQHGGGVLALSTGFGKTCVALYAACQLKVKTLVIVNKTILAEQWKERIHQFVPGARIGTIQGPSEDVEDKDFVIAMLQSLSQKKYRMQGFGLTVVDECHHIAAVTFSQAMLQTNSPCNLGLSATPQRKDGLTRVISWFMGPTFLTLKRQNENLVCVTTVVHCPDDGYQREPPPTRYGKINFQGVIDRLCGDDDRNQLITETILGLPGTRKVLVLSARRDHCRLLCETIGSAAAVYLGGMRREALAQAAEARVIVATFSVAAEGLDIPALNTLFLVTPQKDVTQACGRIMRGTIGGSPLIIDIQDSWPCVAGQYYTRRRYYKDSGFQVNGF